MVIKPGWDIMDINLLTMFGEGWISITQERQQTTLLTPLLSTHNMFP
jgi:hypothetical protein